MTLASPSSADAEEVDRSSSNISRMSGSGATGQPFLGEELISVPVCGLAWFVLLGQCADCSEEGKKKGGGWMGRGDRSKDRGEVVGVNVGFAEGFISSGSY